MHYLSLCVQTRSAEGSEDNGLCVSFHLLHHPSGISQTGQQETINSWIWLNVLKNVLGTILSERNGTQLFYKHFTFLWTGLFVTFAQACDLLQGSRPSSPLCPPLSLNMRAKLNWHRFSVDVLCFLGYHPSALTPQSRCLGREESPQRLGTCNWGSLAGFILGHCHLKRRTRLFWKHNFAAVNSYFILDCTLSKAFRFEFMLKRHKLVV